MADPTLMVDSGGALVPVAPEAMADAAQLGWVPASPKQVADHQLQEKYGSTEQAAIAGLEGFGKGITGGLSTVLERGLGVDPAGIAGREQANPTAHGAGEILGVGTGLLAPVAKVASAPALIAKAGSAVTRGLAPAAEAATAFGRIVGGATRLGAGSAVEGAFYGAGQVVHEAALGDPHLTAQGALATVGLSAFLAGGLGGAGGVLGGVVKEYTPKDLGAKVAAMLADAESHANLNATNAMPSQIKKTLRGKGDSAQAIGLEGRDLGILKSPLTDSPTAILERAEGIKASSGQALSDIATKASTEGAISNIAAIDAEVRAPLVKALRGRGTTVQVADQLEAVLDRFGQAYADKPLTVDGLWTLRKDLGDTIYNNGKALDPWAKEVNTPIKRVYDHIDGLIEKGIKEASGVDALRAWQAANRQFEVASTFAKLAESGIERSAANNGISLTGTIAAAAGMGHAGAMGGAALGAAGEAVRRRGASAIGWGARILRGADEVAAKTADVVAAARQAGVDSVVPTSAPSSVAVLGALERSNAAIANRVDRAVASIVKGNAGAVARAESESMTAKQTARLRLLAQDPQQMQTALVGMTDAIHDHAPQTAQAAQITAARAIAFLSSKLPKAEPFGPLGKPLPISPAEQAVFMRYQRAVNDPVSVLHDAARGSVTPEALEAVAVVYPQLLTKMRGAAASAMASHKGMPFAARQGLSAIMGQDLDGSSKLTTRAQAAYARNAMSTPGATPTKAANLTTAQRTMTPAQQAAGRR